MSGGSYDYLFGVFHMAEGYENARRPLINMINDLKTENWDLANRDQVAAGLEKVLDRLEPPHVDDDLIQVMRAIEWWQSCDWGIEQVREAVKTWLDNGSKVWEDNQ